MSCPFTGRRTRYVWYIRYDGGRAYYRNARCIVIRSGNPVASHPARGQEVLRGKTQKGSEAYRDRPSQDAPRVGGRSVARIRPGTDTALALGMLRVIVKENLYDRSFVEKWCVGFDELRKRVRILRRRKSRRSPGYLQEML